LRGWLWVVFVSVEKRERERGAAGKSEKSTQFARTRISPLCPPLELLLSFAAESLFVPKKLIAFLAALLLPINVHFMLISLHLSAARVATVKLKAEFVSL